MQELTDAIHSLVNGKAVEPDGVSVELFKITLYGGVHTRNAGAESKSRSPPFSSLPSPSP